MDGEPKRSHLDQVAGWHVRESGGKLKETGVVVGVVGRGEHLRKRWEQNPPRRPPKQEQEVELASKVRQAERQGAKRMTKATFSR